MTDSAHQALRDLEASILGAVLLRPSILGELPLLEVDDFLDLRHRAVFSAMRNLEAAAVAIDVVTLEAELAKHSGGSGSVDFAFLGELALRVPTASNAMEYARQVREASLSRRVVDALDGVLAQAKRHTLTGGELLSAALASLSRIDAEQPDGTIPISTLVKRRFNQLDQIAQERLSGARTMTGYQTGIGKLDETIGGVQPGIVTIVAARPGMGKSSLGLAIADGCSEAGFGAHVFSLEDTEEAYADRTLSRSSEVPAEAMRNVSLSRVQMSDITMAAARLRGRHWLIDSRSGISADEIVRCVRRHRRANDTRVVIVDYVQLVKRPPRLSPHDALTEIITTLADAAKHDKLAYVVMSQLNRKIEERQDKRPQLSDLRESGSLEERAKCVLGIYRGSYYGAPIKGIDWHPDWDGHRYEPDADEHAAQVQVSVLKNNNGRTGTVFAHWNGPTTRME
jgi:replicative DNA helicase